MWSRIQIRFPKKLLCCWSFPGASWNGWTRSDWKTKPKPTTAMAGDSSRRQASLNMRLDQITRDVIETLRFSGASSNANCALRTLRRMLHKAEEWTLIRHAPKLKLMKEYGRSLRLDDEAEKKLLVGAAACNWRKRSLQLFQDIIILMRDTGMRNERELYRMRIENMDWESRVIFVPDSKTQEGRRRVPMSSRAF